jgi:hypothetical protein
MLFLLFCSSVLEGWIAKGLDARIGVAVAARHLATLLRVKLIERDKARRLRNAMDQGDAEALAAHRAQFPSHKPKGNGAPHD